ncbi:MAG: SRPBCC domain-containing protein [Candidatus Heimdallarchaeota archaeon]
MENIIQITISIECDVKQAFRMFTVNELLENWLTVKAEVEPKVGGKYELFWDPDSREINSTIGCSITGFEQDNFVSFNWKGPVEFQPFMNSADPLTHVIVFFSPNSNDPNKTIIRLFHTGWRKDREWQQARNYFEKAWSQALQELKNKLKNNSTI